MRTLTVRLPVPPKNIVHLVQQRLTESLSGCSWPCWRIWATERRWKFTSQTEREPPLPRSAGCVFQVSNLKFGISDRSAGLRSVLSPHHSVLTCSVLSSQLSVVYCQLSAGQAPAVSCQLSLSAGSDPRFMVCCQLSGGQHSVLSPHHSVLKSVLSPPVVPGLEFGIWNFRPVCRSALSPQSSALSPLSKELAGTAGYRLQPSV